MGDQVPCGSSCIRHDATCKESSGCSCLALEAKDLTNFDTHGGGELVLHGHNFGPVGTEVVVRYASVAEQSSNAGRSIQCLVAGGHSSILCTIPPDTGNKYNWLVNVGGQDSNWSAGTTGYKPPVVTLVEGAGAVGSTTKGGDLLRLHGAQFGPRLAQRHVAVSYGRKPDVGDWFVASDCSVTVTGEVIECKTGAGTGANNSLKVSIGGQSSMLPHPDAVHYRRPIATKYQVGNSIDPEMELADTQSFATPGGDRIIIVGSDFGATIESLDRVTYGRTGTEYTADKCSMIREHEEIQCVLNEGAGMEHTWLVTVDGQKSTAQTTAYRRPSISRIQTPQGLNATEMSTDGGELVRIVGKNFGPRVDYLQAISYGPHKRAATYIVDPSSCTDVPSDVNFTQIIECTTVPGVGSRLMWSLMIAGQVSQESVTSIMSYGSPKNLALVSLAGEEPAEVTEVPTDALDNEGLPLKLHIQGDNFGLCDERTRQQIELRELSGAFATSSVLVTDVLDASRNRFQLMQCGAYSDKMRYLEFVMPEMTSVRKYQMRVQINSFAVDDMVASDWNLISFSYEPPPYFWNFLDAVVQP